MKITKEHIFPTVVYNADNCLEEEHIESMKKHIMSSYNKNPITGWQSSPNLTEHKEYKSLVDIIHANIKNVFTDLKYEYDDYVITDMWSNVSKKGEFHRPHTHSNNILSGVYYIQIDNNDRADIQFYDPRPQSDVLTPKVKEQNKENSHVWYWPSIVNRMVLFPSWLQHYVSTNDSNTPRISIAFNVMLKGIVGASSSYQSGEF
jgi:uncharacterized protein (TIGR02466 family)